MSTVDLPDAKYGFWVALGVVAALMLVALVRSLVSRVASKAS